MGDFAPLFLKCVKGFASELLPEIQAVTFYCKTTFKSFFCQQDMHAILRRFQVVIAKNTARCWLTSDGGYV
jgi:hypothetical protein